MTRRQPTELDFRPIPEVSVVEQESAMRVVVRHCPDDAAVMAMLFAPPSRTVASTNQHVRRVRDPSHPFLGKTMTQVLSETAELTRRIVALYETGMPRKDIAAELKVGQTTVQTHLSRAGVSGRRKAEIERKTA